MDAINDGNGFLCESHLWTEVGLSVMGNFLMRCLPVCDLGLAAGAVHPGMDRTFEARINCKLPVMWFITLSFFTCRWSKTRPERHNFPAGINPSLPQATHPQGTSCVYGWDSWTLGHSLDISSKKNIVFSGMIPMKKQVRWKLQWLIKYLDNYFNQILASAFG